MLKYDDKTRKTGGKEAHSKLLLIGVMVLLGVFFISFISATSNWTQSGLGNGLISYYSCDEPSGTVTQDNVTYLYNATDNSSNVVGGTGILGKGLSFNGINGFETILKSIPLIDKVSISLWTNFSITTGNMMLFSKRGGNETFGVAYTENHLSFYIWGSDGQKSCETFVGYMTSNATSWVNTIVTYNGTHQVIWKNGVINKTCVATGIINNNPTVTEIGGGNNWGWGQKYFGYMDEIGIWNRSLTEIEIGELYNSGIGLFYGTVGTPSISVNLTSPTNATIISTAGTNFSVNLSITGTNYSYEWKNNTYNIWFSNGTLFNQTFVNSLTTNTTNISRTISNFIIGNYFHNSYACYGNLTYSNCSWATNNYTFQYRPFSLDSQTYTSSIYETSRQTYTANITTIPSILNVIAKLNYNGTLKTATSICSLGSCYINISFDIPLVTLETQNKSSYWNITLFDGTNSYSFNTIESNFTQNVSMIHLAKCNTTYPVQTLNFTAWNEKNLSRIGLFSIAGTFETWLGSGTVKKSQSFQNTSISEFKLCLLPNQTMYTDSEIRYAFDNDNVSYITRDYYFQNASLTNTSQDIYLYLLEAEDSTTFIDKVQDQKLSAVKDALIYIQRYYPETGLYRTVQIAKTDSNGETVGFYETELADYKHIIIKNGVTLLETSPQKVVGKEVPFTLTFTVGEALDYPWSVFESNPAITTSLTYNDTTKLVSFTYVDSTGATTLGRLLVYELSRSNNTIRTICNSSSTESSATITCNMTAEGEGSFLAYGYIQTDVSDVFDFIIATARDILDRTGLLMGFLIILTAGFAFIWNPTAGIVGVEGAIIFVNVIGLVSFSPVFIFASIAIAILALILLKS